MSTNPRRRRQRGLSLIELVLFIVIVGVGVTGVLNVFNLTTRVSADPLRRKQALLLAEGLMEEVTLAGFTYCDPTDASAGVATGAFITQPNGPVGCTSIVEQVGQAAPEPVGSRPYDNVNDYVSQYNLPQAAFNNAAGVLVDAAGLPFGLAGYAATVAITPTDTLGGIASGAAPAANTVLRVTVTVTYGSNGGEAVVLDGYRTRYQPTVPR